jgi:hypothetical protein
MHPVLDRRSRPLGLQGQFVVRLAPDDFDGAYDDVPVKAVAAA